MERKVKEREYKENVEKKRKKGKERKLKEREYKENVGEERDKREGEEGLLTAQHIQFICFF